MSHEHEGYGRRSFHARRRSALALASVIAMAGCDPGPDAEVASDFEDSAAETGAPDEAAEVDRPPSEEGHPMANPLERAAPMIEASSHPTGKCDKERCEGVVPASSPTNNLIGSGKRARGSNSQLAIPQNLMLADVNADGSAEFLQYVSNKLFVSKTDFNKTGVLHLYTHRPIKRVLTGDFHGDGYDQTCVITDDNAFLCYGISTDRRELWWWFTQGNFIGDNEDSIVGDFDGDGREDVLVYPRAGGAYRMYSIKGAFFFGATPSFNPGNLGTAAPGLQLRAGDFGGDGRDDLLVVNGWGQAISYASVWDGASHTFWWAFTSNAWVVGGNDQVTVARIDDNAVDDVVLRDRVTGATRFHRLQWAGGPLPTIPIGTGQISTGGNSLLFWTSMHGPIVEPGASMRDDAMVYDLSWNMFVRSDARWDGANLTYWWAYTQWAPANHTGWAAFTAKPWLLLKCKFSDVSTEPRNNAFYRELALGGGGLVQYWRDLSYGSWDLTGTNVVDAWQTMSVTNAFWTSSLSRWDRAGRCIDAYSGSKSGYVNIISIVNGEGDAGNSGGRVLATPGSSNLTFLAHETGHTFGWWDHSFDDTTRKNADWSAPGEYFDFWDIMSAMAVFAFNHPTTGTAGPEMNAPYKTKQGFIPEHRIARLFPGTTTQSWRSNIAAINRPEANGPLMVRIGADNNNYYTVEYRMKSGWDQGIPRATVLVHRVTNGVSVLITAGGGPERLVGSVSTYTLAGRTITVRVHGFAGEGYTADVTVEY
jgi:hypothetical protein